jgi:hypothetical protein
MTKNELIKKFQKKAVALRKAKKTQRYLRVVGKLKRAKLIDAPGIPDYGGPVELTDVLWAGKIEPRILEVLPTLIVTRPKYLRVYQTPKDLKTVVDQIRTGKATAHFRGVAPKDYCKWLPENAVGSSVLKTIRMRPEEIQMIRNLKSKLGVRSDADVIRKGLELLNTATLKKS